MVRRSILVVAAWSLSVSASAQVDWRSAGGDLFPARGQVEAAQDDDEVPRLPPMTQPYLAEIEAAASRHGLDPKLLHALVVVESAYRPAVCSRAGACGLAQLMPGTAQELGVRDRSDPADNLGGGADYLSRQILRFGDVRLALAAFNAGPSRVARLGRIPSIPETQSYVANVVSCYLALAAGRTVRSVRDCRTAEVVP